MGPALPLRALRPLGLALLLATAPAASAQQGEVCERQPAASRGPISLVILASGAKVRELAASVKDTPVVARDANTVIFADGRVITADVASAGEHLNALGWGGRRIDVAVSLPTRRPRPRSSYG